MGVNHGLLQLLARQDGLVTIEQACGYGVPARTVRGWVGTDGWSRVAPRVLLAGGHPWSDRARVRAAALWIGDRGVVSGPAAAWWHRMLADAPALALGRAGWDLLRFTWHDLNNRPAYVLDEIRTALCLTPTRP